MVYLSIEVMQEAMRRRRNIRNIAVIAHVDHGKTTLTDSLLARAGVIAASQAGTKRATDTLKAEQEKGITIKSTAISLYYDMDPSNIKQLGPNGSDGTGYLINLVDSPGHVDFSPEVTAALRIVDGAMVVVDCVSGVSVQTETVLRQALCEHIKPVLMMNKLDRAIFEKALSPEETYCTLRSVVENVNALIGVYCDNESPMGDIMMDPAKGNVAFGSGLHGWGFNLRQFAQLYASKFGIKEEKIMKRLWGDNFYNPETRQWCKQKDTGSTRGFNFFVLEPLIKILQASSDGDKSQAQALLRKLGFQLSSSDLQLEGKDFMRAVMKTWLPAADAMLDMIVFHLPSPVTAQAYRTQLLYEGPLDDEAAVAMKSCDPNGPLMMYIAKMIPSPEKGRFYAVGRIFSGTITHGQKVRIMGPDYDPSSAKKKDLYFQTLPRAVMLMGGSVQAVDEAVCGNIVALTGVDKFLQKSGTISTFDHAHNLKILKFSVSPVVRVAVSVVHAQDLVKLVEGLRRLNKAEPLVQVSNESGQYVVAGAGELHLEIILKDLEETYAGVPIKKSDPVVKYCETVTAESDRICLAKSSNKLNRIFMSASPLPNGLSEEIDKGELSQDLKVRARYLADTYSFDVNQARKIWCFGPNTSGPNLVVDATQGVNTSDIKDAVCAGFQWVSDEGPLCEESMRGVRFDLRDAMIHSDPAHRGGGQIIPATRRVMLGSVLTAAPSLMEPVYLVETQCPVAVMGSVMSVISRRRGCIVEEVYPPGSPLCTLKGFLPVNEAFGFPAELMSETSGQAFPQCSFDHWQMLPGDPLTPGSKAAEVVASVRQRKGLPPAIPTVESLLDKL
ncbi:116 kda u5 small nuclear ribonucleoprotein component protein [Plakobranchus ocellatus]|uniref:116 kDa u5 small nuclear ribonucleoprotein component protein n=1 Tax=Plakobranchus ocellatus TaxID=259542 RepID=A0AAV4DTU7_9GAST|nr:116 kda u5 small nuclear ribonucleoprotein component protein [Plakobranchus ocellatus]